MALRGVTADTVTGKLPDIVEERLSATFVRKWTPNTAFSAGWLVLNPSGQVVSANTSFTSGASYNAADWTVVPGGLDLAAVVGIRRAKDTIVLLGDSTVAQNGGPIRAATTGAVDLNKTFASRGPFVWAMTLLRWPLTVLHNAGFSGYRADQLPAVFAAQVAAFSPGWVDVQVGVNDVFQGRSVAQITAALTSLYDSCAAIGARVLANTVTTCTSFSGATTTSAVSVSGTTLALSACSVHVGDQLGIDTGANYEVVTASTAGSGAASVTVSAFTKAHASGVLVVNLTKLAVLNGVNQWLDAYAKTHPNVVLADMNAAYSDPTTGGPLSGVALDGLHPSVNGAALTGKQKADALERWMNPTVGRSYAKDTLNYSPNPTMDGTAGALSAGSVTGSAATGFTLYGSGTTGVASKVARTDGIPGEWQQFVITAGSNTALLWQATSTITLASTGLVVGDRVWLEFEFEVDGDYIESTANATSVDCYLSWVGGSGNSPRAMQHASGSDGKGTLAPGRGRLRTQAATIPASTTGITMAFVFIGTGTFRIGRNRIVKGDIA